MSEQSEQLEMSEEQAAKWVRDHFQAANKYLAEQGIITDKILSKESRYLLPIVAIWKFKTQDRKEVWVINGDVPTDMMNAKAAKDAREAMRHFSMQWQMKAEVVAQTAEGNQEKLRYATYLVNRAENLYQVLESKDFWQEEQHD